MAKDWVVYTKPWLQRPETVMDYLARYTFRTALSDARKAAATEPATRSVASRIVIWPIIAMHASQRLGIELDFLSYPQEPEQGKEMSEWIVQNVKRLHKENMLEAIEKIPHP